MPKYCLPLTGFPGPAPWLRVPVRKEAAFLVDFISGMKSGFFFFPFLFFPPYLYFQHMAGFSSQPDPSCCYWFHFPSRPHLVPLHPWKKSHSKVAQVLPSGAFSCVSVYLPTELTFLFISLGLRQLHVKSFTFTIIFNSQINLQRR